MAFRPVRFEQGKMVMLPAANSTTITKGNALTDNGSGYLTNAAASTAVDIYYVAAETVTTTSTGQLVKCLETTNVLFEADCDDVWSIVDQGTYADLGGAGNVNPDASTHDLFYILKGVGTAETDTKVLGFFTRAVPNS